MHETIFLIEKNLVEKNWRNGDSKGSRISLTFKSVDKHTEPLTKMGDLRRKTGLRNRKEA